MEEVYPLNKDLTKIYSELVDAELSLASDDSVERIKHRVLLRSLERRNSVHM